MRTDRQTSAQRRIFLGHLSVRLFESFPEPLPGRRRNRRNSTKTKAKNKRERIGRFIGMWTDVVGTEISPLIGDNGFSKVFIIFVGFLASRAIPGMVSASPNA